MAGARAEVGPIPETSSWGIRWVDFPEMGLRGGFTGPVLSRDAAIESVDTWATAWNRTVEIVDVAEVIPPPYASG